MNNFRDLIRSIITKQFGGIVKFSKDNKIRQATVSDLLNDRKSVTLTTFQKIIKPLGIDIMKTLPEKFIQVDTVYWKGETYHKGCVFDGQKIVACLGCAENSYQAILFDDGKGKFILKVV